MNKLTASAASLVVTLSALSASAGGSIDTKTVINEIADSALKTTLEKNFALAPVALGMRIGSTVAPNLGGARVGPYLVCAKPSRARGGYTMTLVLNAETHFRDADGKEVGLGPDAFSIDEKIVTVEVSALSDLCQK